MFLTKTKVVTVKKFKRQSKTGCSVDLYIGSNNNATGYNNAMFVGRSIGLTV